jgi:hypothetical protein
MEEESERETGESPAGIGGDVTGVVAAAAGRETLVEFVGDANENQDRQENEERTERRAAVISPGQTEEHAARGEQGGVNGLVCPTERRRAEVHAGDG